jgi:hypothetical protein
MFKDWQKNVHDEEWSGRPTVVNDDPAQNVDQKVYERRLFAISELSSEFLQISYIVL